MSDNHLTIADKIATRADVSHPATPQKQSSSLFDDAYNFGKEHAGTLAAVGAVGLAVAVVGITRGRALAAARQEEAEIFKAALLTSKTPPLFSIPEGVAGPHTMKIVELKGATGNPLVFPEGRIWSPIGRGAQDMPHHMTVTQDWDVSHLLRR